jgi:regulator of sirC expression with transglutaminase-like and TPR domain
MSHPTHCRIRSFQTFGEALRDLGRPDGIVRAAVAIAMHELSDADPDRTVRALDELAARIRGRVTTGRPQAWLAHLHAVLFDEEGFRGRPEGRWRPEDAYLPAVLETRRGLPISIALVYHAVGRRLGLDVRGVNAPGHFLAHVDLGTERMLVDPHDAGRVLTREEAFRRMERAVGSPVQRTEVFLREASPRQWVSRMLQNLQAMFAHEGRQADLAAMLELRALLPGRA